jgi:hypothetical protein
MRKVAIIGTVGYPAKYGGFETLAEHLCDNISGLGEFEIYIYCSFFKYNKVERKIYFKNINRIFLPISANGPMSLVYDGLSVCHAIFRGCDTLLLLGVSGSWILPFVRKFYKGKIIVNVDGVESRRSKWSALAKRLLLILENWAIQYSDHIIADNVAIESYIYENYSQRSTVISYGGDHFPQEGWIGDLKHKFENYSLALCRIEPENNVEMILEAFVKTPSENLVFVGNWDHSVYAKEMLARYSDFDNIFLHPATYDSKEVSALRFGAKFYIHGHSSGGTNPSLVEALFFDCFIAAYNCDFNRYTLSQQGNYFDDSGALASIISDPNPLKHDEELKKSYTWRVVCKSYRELLNDNSN